MFSNNIYITKIQEISFNNKYTKWYCNIITNALSRASSKNEANEILSYSESHHIVPECLFIDRIREGSKGHLDGNSNDKNNLVHLSAREHFILHMLLPKMLLSKNARYKIASAIYMMMHDGGKYYNAKTYETAKKIASTNHRMRLPEYRTAKSLSQKEFAKSEKGIAFFKNKSETQKITMIGEGNPMFGKESGFKNKSHTPEHIDKMKSKKGEHHHNYMKPQHSIKYTLIDDIENESYIYSRKNVLLFLNIKERMFKNHVKNGQPINGYIIKKPNTPIYLATKDGIDFDVYNLKQFCKDNDLYYQCMIHVAGGTKPQHKGWTIKKINR